MFKIFKALAVIGGMFVATSLALADEKQPQQPDEQMPMMQSEDGMSGMMQGEDGKSGMKGMMQKMGPMMEQCRDMMAAMSDHMKSGTNEPDSNDG